MRFPVVLGIAACLVVAGCESDSGPAHTPPVAALPACAGPTIEADPSQVTRWEAPSSSEWWVTYAILTNDCDRPITIRDVIPAARQPSEASWGGRAVVTPSSGTVDVYVAGSVALAGEDAKNYTIAVDDSIRLAARVKLGNAAEPQRVPALQLRMAVEGSEAELPAKLGPDVSFCVCPQPASG